MDTAHIEALVADVRAHASEHDLVVAVAESLTGGALSQALAKGQEAGTWFAGGVVAYRNETKYRALDVPEGPVVTPETARQMARGVLDLVGADVAVAVTGVGGPGPEEGRRAGTVFGCVATRTGTHDFASEFDGDPEEVVEATIVRALQQLSGVLSSL